MCFLACRTHITRQPAPARLINPLIISVALISPLPIQVLRKLSAVDTNQDVMWRDVKCRDMILASSMPQVSDRYPNPDPNPDPCYGPPRDAESQHLCMGRVRSLSCLNFSHTTLA